MPYGLFTRALSARLERHRLSAAIVLALGIGLILWLAASSGHDREAGRWGSWVWFFARHTPSLGGKSPLVLVLASLGAFSLLAMAMHAVQHRYFPSELLLLLCYFIGYSSQPFAWQRYLEPHILLTLGVFCSRLGETRRMVLAGPVLLFVGFYVFSLARIHGLLPGLLG